MFTKTHPFAGFLRLSAAECQERCVRKLFKKKALNICRQCREDTARIRNDPLSLYCYKCGNSFSAFQKTTVLNSKLPIRTWLKACGIFSQPKVITSKEFAKKLCVSYRIAHNIRATLRTIGRKLVNKIEIPVRNLKFIFIGGFDWLLRDQYLLFVFGEGLSFVRIEEMPNNFGTEIVYSAELSAPTLLTGKIIESLKNIEIAEKPGAKTRRSIKAFCNTLKSNLRNGSSINLHSLCIEWNFKKLYGPDGDALLVRKLVRYPDSQP